MHIPKISPCPAIVVLGANRGTTLSELGKPRALNNLSQNGNYEWINLGPSFFEGQRIPRGRSFRLRSPIWDDLGQSCD